MQEMIYNLINNNINGIIFYSVILIIPTILVILILVLNKPKLSKKLSLISVLCIIFVFAVLSIVPLVCLTVDLYKDNNEQVLIKTEGVVEERLTKAKMPVVVIDGEQFILSEYVETVGVGEYCEIGYLKNSKYVLELYLK